jgi:hypothetical protein
LKLTGARYTVIADDPLVMVIRDIGPWDDHPTITNAAESVVEQLAPSLNGEYNEKRRLLYFDSLGELSELKVQNGRFAGFAPATKTDHEKYDHRLD